MMKLIFPNVATSQQLPPLSSCSHPTIQVSTCVSPHIHFQVAFSSNETYCSLPPLLLASPSYRGKLPAGKGTQQGTDRHVTVDTAKTFVSEKQRVKAAATPVPPMQKQPL